MDNPLKLALPQYSIIMMFVLFNSNTMCATSGAGYVYPIGIHQLTSGRLWGSCDLEELEITKEIFRIRKSKKDRQHNGQKKKSQKDKQRSTKHTYKIKDRVTRAPLIPRVNTLVFYYCHSQRYIIIHV
jgi:hypothetical protein